MEKWREELYLSHSAKGTTWKKHKYIAIKNGAYIYPEPEKASYGARSVKYADRDSNGEKNNRRLSGDMYYSQSRTYNRKFRARNDKWGLSTATTKNGNLANRAAAGLTPRSRFKTANPSASIQSNTRFERNSFQARANRSTVTTQNTPSHVRGVVHSMANKAMSAASSAISTGKQIVSNILDKLKKR